MNSWYLVKNNLLRIFANPLILLLSLLWAFLILGMVIWLPNIELVKVVWDNAGLDVGTKLRIMLEMYKLVLSVLGVFSILLILAFCAVMIVGTGIFIDTIHKLHRNHVEEERIKSHVAGLVLGGGMAMIGVAMLIPIVTAAGLVYNTSLHLLGLILPLCGMVLISWSTLNLFKSTNPTQN